VDRRHPDRGRDRADDRTIGMSAVFFQDMFGLITFDAKFEQLAAIRPRIGKNQVIHCLDAYQFGEGLQPLKRADSISMSLAGFMRKTSMVPVISDFLFDEAEAVLKELSQLNSAHDVFIVLIDSAFAFELPPVSAGWIEAFDVETGTSKVLSRKALRTLSARTRTWQDQVAAWRRRSTSTSCGSALTSCRPNRDERVLAERRLRKAA